MHNKCTPRPSRGFLCETAESVRASAVSVCRYIRDVNNAMITRPWTTIAGRPDLTNHSLTVENIVYFIYRLKRNKRAMKFLTRKSKRDAIHGIDDIIIISAPTWILLLLLFSLSSFMRLLLNDSLRLHCSVMLFAVVTHQITVRILSSTIGSVSVNFSSPKAFFFFQIPFFLQTRPPAPLDTFTPVRTSHAFG